MNIGTLDRELTKKVIRLFIGALCFLCISTVVGLNIRGGHQIFYSLFVIILSALLMKNIWLTLFIWWSALLFAMSRFEVGQIYITNIFYGAILYYMTKIAFDKEHIKFFINMVLWVLVANLLFGILQVLNFDFIYLPAETLKFTCINGLPSPNGFMGNSGVMASLCALSIPFLATRRSPYLALLLFIPIFILRSFISLMAGGVVIMFILWFKVDRKIWFMLLGLLLFIPIFILRSFISLMAGGVVIMFILWFKVDRKIWFMLLGLLLVAIAYYLVRFDLPGTERLQIWKLALADANSHPIRGWGMDSFKRFVSTKQFIYTSKVSIWDNPHNLIVSLFYEFGFISLLLLGGYLRQAALWFKNSLKDSDTLALSGFLIAFFVISMAGFPMFLARTAVLIIPVFALFEISTREVT